MLACNPVSHTSLATRLSIPDGAAALQRVLGEKVRRLREARGLSRSALAAAAGLSVGRVSVIESGRGNPRVATLGAIASALDVEVASLLVENAALPSDKPRAANKRG